MRPIFLVGYMGSGKTTLGKALARHMGMEFIDLDHYIEGRFHATVRQIFDTHGEEGFRDIESHLLAEVAEFEDVVVACGGGTPCFGDNMELMNRNGVTVLLDASVDVLHARLLHGRAQRPLIARLSDDELRRFIAEALQKRAPFYDRAAVRFDSAPLDDPALISVSAGKLAEILLDKTAHSTENGRIHSA